MTNLTYLFQIFRICWDVYVIVSHWKWIIIGFQFVLIDCSGFPNVFLSSNWKLPDIFMISHTNYRSIVFSFTLLCIFFIMNANYISFPMTSLIIFIFALNFWFKYLIFWTCCCSLIMIFALNCMIAPHSSIHNMNNNLNFLLSHCSFLNHYRFFLSATCPYSYFPTSSSFLSLSFVK